MVLVGCMDCNLHSPQSVSTHLFVYKDAMKSFQFPRIVKRKLFTIIFGGVGKRRYVQDFMSYTPSPLTRVVAPLSVKRFKMQKIRRAHQGWRNRTFGTIQAIKIRLQFGRRPVVPQFRR